MALANVGVTRSQSEVAVDVVLAEHAVGPWSVVSPLIGVLQSRSEGFAGGDKTPQFLTLSVARDRYVLTEEYIEGYVVVASFARLANAQRALKEDAGKTQDR